MRLFAPTRIPALMKTLVALSVTLGLLICLPGGVAQELDHDVWVKLDSGNLELLADDGSEVSIAPGTDMTITHAARFGEETRVTLKTGHLHVSNLRHEHSEVLLVHAGEHVVEIERAAVLISHTENGVHVALRHGKSVGLRGHGLRLTEPMSALHKHTGPPILIPMTHGAVKGLIDRFRGAGGPIDRLAPSPDGGPKRGDAGGRTQFAQQLWHAPVVSANSARIALNIMPGADP